MTVQKNKRKSPNKSTKKTSRESSQSISPSKNSSRNSSTKSSPSKSPLKRSESNIIDHFQDDARSKSSKNSSEKSLDKSSDQSTIKKSSLSMKEKPLNKSSPNSTARKKSPTKSPPKSPLSNTTRKGRKKSLSKSPPKKKVGHATASTHSSHSTQSTEYTPSNTETETTSAHSNPSRDRPEPLTLIPIIYGNTCVPLENSFLWTFYLKHAKDPYYAFPFISHVVFNLHESFGDKSTITRTKAPFEVTMEGWGEFEAEIQIFTSSNAEPSCELTHIIKLFGQTGQVISEIYDEFLVRGDHLVIENENRSQSISVDPLRSKILPIVLRSEFSKYSLQDIEKKLIEGDYSRYKCLERIRLEMIRDCRQKIEEEIKNAEVQLQQDNTKYE